MAEKKYFAIIGGSGLYSLDVFEDTREVVVETPFGMPSAPLRIGKVEGQEVVFLARHGDGHVFNPSEVNYRANIYALKKIGVSKILSVSAVGSLKQEICPGHFVIVDQFLDRTKNRASTFFENGIVAHVSFAKPTSQMMRDLLAKACKEIGITCHKKGTYVCMEGPQFSTLAESESYRTLGADVIGMTSLPEAKLAREAEIDYATLALSTDYDCWHADHDAVTIDQIISVLTANVQNAQKVIQWMACHMDLSAPAECEGTLKNAILTHRSKITPEVKERLAPLILKYF